MRKGVCPNCNGTGAVYSPTFDSSFIVEEPCFSCWGTGIAEEDKT